MSKKTPKTNEPEHKKTKYDLKMEARRKAEKKDKIAEMENENRNRFLRDYLEEHLMEMLMMEASCAGCIEKVENMIQEYIYN